MSGRTAGIRMQKTPEEGQRLLDNFFNGFPNVKKAIDDSKKFLRENGYVEDFIGRCRHIDDIYLPPYEARYKTKPEVDPAFNPFFECSNRFIADDPVRIWQQILDSYIVLSNARSKASDTSYKVKHEMHSKTYEYLKKIAAFPEIMLKKEVSDTDLNKQWDKRTNKEKILQDINVVLHKLISTGEYCPGRKTLCIFEKNEATADLFELFDWYTAKYPEVHIRDITNDSMILFAWTGRIAQAERQCFNARIQGSAATLTKIAMIDIANDKVMNDCQAKLIIPVHDELLVECPAYYADKVEKRLPEIMIGAAAKHITEVGMKCDPYNVSRWYADEYAVAIQEEFKKLEKGDPKKGIEPLDREAAINKTKQKFPEIPEQALLDVITGKTDEVIF